MLAVMEEYPMVEIFQLQDYQNFWNTNCPTSEPVSGRHKPLPHIVVADDTFPLRPYMMKPCPRSTENLEHCYKSFQLQVISCKKHRRKYFWSFVSRVLSVEETSTPSTRKG
jgi:hypothetical protein